MRGVPRHFVAGLLFLLLLGCEPRSPGTKLVEWDGTLVVGEGDCWDDYDQHGLIQRRWWSRDDGWCALADAPAIRIQGAAGRDGEGSPGFPVRPTR